jgi:hypothetical protein
MHDILILTEPVELVEITTQMHDILILTEPVELVGMLKSQLKCTISTHWTSGVGGNAKTQMHDILFSLNQWSWWEC